MTIRLPDAPDLYDPRWAREMERVLELKFDELDATIRALQAPVLIITVPTAQVTLTTTAPSVVVA